MVAGMRMGTGIMGDMSVEPSMEEILSSIKRIIAEEGEATQGRARRPHRAAPMPEPEPEPEIDAEEVLELSDHMPQPAADSRLTPPVRQHEPAPQPADRAAPRAPAAPSPAPQPEPQTQQPQMHQPNTTPRTAPEPIVSQQALAASLGSLETLSKLIVKPAPESDGTLEGLVREMLRPMLRDWLDANLPDMVETLVAREIAKITSQMR